MKVASSEEILAFETALKNLEMQQEERNKAFLKGADIERQIANAVSKAKSNNKKVFILFHIEGCNGCTVIKHLVEYDTAIVKTLEENYETVLAEMTAVQSSIVNTYNLYSFPSYILLDADGNLFKQNYGCYLHGDGVAHNLLEWLKPSNDPTK
jgi:thioredoxin-related protein